MITPLQSLASGKADNSGLNIRQGVQCGAIKLAKQHQTNMETKIELPASKLVKSQKKDYGPKFYSERGEQFRIIAHVRYDDECGNGHNSFSITATIDRKDGRGVWRDDMGGCCHDEVAKHFPELAPFIKWHLTSSDGPMHYVANTVYHAGDKDCNGLRKGEFRQHVSRGGQNGGVSGVPNWVLEIPDGMEKDVYAATKPAPVTLQWKAYGRTGEGQERKLDAARRSAVWLDATDEDLTAPGLEARLLARLPALMAEFKQAVESLGFTY